jgi:hypothetical protein
MAGQIYSNRHYVSFRSPRSHAVNYLRQEQVERSGIIQPAMQTYYWHNAVPDSLLYCIMSLICFQYVLFLLCSFRAEIRYNIIAGILYIRGFSR